MNLLRCDDPAEAAAWCASERAAGRSLGFVPTMGALHEGHLELVRRAARENDVAAVSVFVNPLQFDDARDLAAYPRDLEGDALLLDGEGCGLLFTGTLASFFPEARTPAEIEAVDPGPGAVGLEGEFRRGHFGGVATIVRRLFELTRPHRAYFGAKDFQQTLVVEHVARQLDGGPAIVVCPTSREPDGLARSSRNRLLGESVRERAPLLFRALSAARSAWSAGERDAEALAEVLRATLRHPEVELEYAEIRDPARWEDGEPRGSLTRARALVAARVGGVRLIDNLSLDAGEGGA